MGTKDGQYKSDPTRRKHTTWTICVLSYQGLRSPSFSHNLIYLQLLPSSRMDCRNKQLFAAAAPCVLARTSSHHTHYCRARSMDPMPTNVINNCKWEGVGCEDAKLLLARGHGDPSLCTTRFRNQRHEYLAYCLSMMFT